MGLGGAALRRLLDTPRRGGARGDMAERRKRIKEAEEDDCCSPRPPQAPANPDVNCPLHPWAWAPGWPRLGPARLPSGPAHVRTSFGLICSVLPQADPSGARQGWTATAHRGHLTCPTADAHSEPGLPATEQPQRSLRPGESREPAGTRLRDVNTCSVQGLNAQHGARGEPPGHGVPGEKVGPLIPRP